MTPAAFRAECTARGIDLCVAGDKLRARGPMQLPAVTDYLRRHKADLIALLTDDSGCEQLDRENENDLAKTIDRQVSPIAPPGAVGGDGDACGQAAEAGENVLLSWRPVEMGGRRLWEVLAQVGEGLDSGQETGYGETRGEALGDLATVAASVPYLTAGQRRSIGDVVALEREQLKWDGCLEETPPM